MEIVTTKERFLQKKDSFKAELCRLNNGNDKDELMACIQTCLGDVFGEEYKDQFTESEVHILNALLKAIGVDAKSFLNEYSPKGNTSPSQETNKSGHSSLIDLADGLNISKVRHCELSTGPKTYMGILISARKSQTANTISANNLIDVDKVVWNIESICEKVDSFMNVCRTQIKKISK